MYNYNVLLKKGLFPAVFTSNYLQDASRLSNLTIMIQMFFTTIGSQKVFLSLSMSVKNQFLKKKTQGGLLDNNLLPDWSSLFISWTS